MQGEGIREIHEGSLGRSARMEAGKHRVSALVPSAQNSMNRRDWDGAAATGVDFPRPAINCDWGLADVLARDVEMGLAKGSAEPS